MIMLHHLTVSAWFEQISCHSCSIYAVFPPYRYVNILPDLNFCHTFTTNQMIYFLLFCAAYATADDVSHEQVSRNASAIAVVTVPLQNFSRIASFFMLHMVFCVQCIANSG